MSNDSKGTKNWFARHKILTGIGVIFIFFILIAALGGGGEGTESTSGSSTSNNGQTSQQEVKEEERIQVTAKELYQAYSANTIAADAEYEGKKLEITGVVDGIGKDILDQPYITLDVGELINNVQCMLKDEAVAQASQLAQGTTVTLYGENPNYLLNVIVKKCTIAE